MDDLLVVQHVDNDLAKLFSHFSTVSQRNSTSTSKFFNHTLFFLP